MAGQTTGNSARRVVIPFDRCIEGCRQNQIVVNLVHLVSVNSNVSQILRLYINLPIEV